MRSKLLSGLTVFLWALAGCSNSGETPPVNTGGHGGSGSGGQSQSGGTSGGSSSSTGGPGGGGGSSQAGGTSASGGDGSGGASSTGGKTNSGGGSNGGATGTGGTTVMGGAGTGGTTGRGGTSGGGGGTIGSGGMTGSGGAAGSGGTSRSGGTTGAGGVTSAGGMAGRGGATGGSAGGSTGTGSGGAVTVGASGYPAAGASGQAKPSGSGTTVTLLDWAGFKGAVSFTFDDSNKSQIDNYAALQKLNDKGNNVRYTFYLWTGKSESSNNIWTQALKDGHELGNHTKSHQPPGTAADIDAAQTFLKSTFGVTAYSMAAPNGDTSYAPLGVGKFLTDRSAGGVNFPTATTDPDQMLSNPQVALRYWLPCHIPAERAPASEIVKPVKEGQWTIVLVHGFVNGDYNYVSINEFTSAVSSVKAKGTLWIDTMANIASYWIAGYKFSKLTPTTSGSDKTWTWKTSDFSPTFPPGRYLRVKTDGGTLKQGSTTLTWDDHGYYEVSLDAGTLTLSP